MNGIELNITAYVTKKMKYNEHQKQTSKPKKTNIESYLKIL